ncbi:MAG: hypothetical protein ACLS48_12945 [[Eubacterium] siraeum]
MRRKGSLTLKEEMENAVKLTVPMTVDVNIGKRGMILIENDCLTDKGKVTALNHHNSSICSGHCSD